jgi:hypothetical protein
MQVIFKRKVNNYYLFLKKVYKTSYILSIACLYKVVKNMGKVASIGIICMVVIGGLMSVTTLISNNASAGHWSEETWVDRVLDTYSSLSIAIDSNNQPHIVYYDDDVNEELNYAIWTGESWEIEFVVNWDVIGKIALTMDSLDQPHMAFFTEGIGWDRNLKYSYLEGGNWNHTSVSNDQKGSCSISIDSNDYPHITYFNHELSALEYVKYNGTDWEYETVDSWPRNGSYYYSGSSSIAIDSNDYPHIGYYEVYNGDLKYARWNGTDWNIETVDSAENTGEGVSLDLDSNERPHMAYYDDTNEDLKYARWNGNSWKIETVESEGEVGHYPTLELDSIDYPHITYYWYTPENFREYKYATWQGTKWKFETLDVPSARGLDMALDSNDLAHIIYYKDTSERDDIYYMKELPPSVPNPPENIQVIADNGLVELSWDAPKDDGGRDILEYNIFKGMSSGGESYIAKVNAPTTKYDDKDVVNGVTYYYRISAANDLGESSYSSEIIATPRGVPSSPQNFQAIPGIGQVFLYWEPPLSDEGSIITNYIIYRGTTSGEESLLMELGNVTSYTDIDLTNEQTYYYMIAAENDIGEGNPSEEVSATPGYDRMNPPSLVNPGIWDDDGIYLLGWTNASNATNYVLEEDDNSDFQSPTIIYSNSKTHYQVNGKANGEYFYRVKATNSNSESGWSSVQSIVVAIMDFDEDGLPDRWEDDYFGNLKQGPINDSDGDSFSNIEEYQAGTDPTKSDDHPIINDDDIEDEDKNKSSSTESSWPILIITSLMIVAIFTTLLFLGWKRKRSIETTQKSAIQPPQSQDTYSIQSQETHSVSHPVEDGNFPLAPENEHNPSDETNGTEPSLPPSQEDKLPPSTE